MKKIYFIKIIKILKSIINKFEMKNINYLKTRQIIEGHKLNALRHGTLL